MSRAYEAAEPEKKERNAILKDLDPADNARMHAHLEEVRMRAGEVIADVNERPSHVYFPEKGIVSIVAVLAEGGTVEVGTIGCEGFVGLPIFLGADTTPLRTMIQIDAVLQRMPVEAFEQALAEIPVLDRVLSLFVDAYLFQVSQNAACNRAHDLAQRAARWLLMTHDRVGSDTFGLTHEFLSMMLGVRRAGVSEAAADLQRRGAIRYSRGRVAITDRSLLEQSSCECYGHVRERFDTMYQRATQASVAD